MTKERKKISFFFFFSRLECGSYQLIFITTIDLICNVILDHIKKVLKGLAHVLRVQKLRVCH